MPITLEDLLAKDEDKLVTDQLNLIEEPAPTQSGLPIPIDFTNPANLREFFAGIGRDIELIKKEPIRALPLTLEALGAGAGAFFGGPLGSATLAVGGRAAGETIESFVLGNPLFTGRNIFELATAGVQGIPFAALGSAARAAGGAKTASRRAQTIVQRVKAAPQIEDLVLKSTQDANKLRQVRFLEQQEAILFETPALGIARTAIPERPSGIGGLDIAGRQLDKPQRTADLDALSARLQIEDLFATRAERVGSLPTESVLPRATSSAPTGQGSHPLVRAILCRGCQLVKL